MADVIAFWLVALLIAALALPIAFTLFRRFPDAGAGLAFPLGLLFAGYAYWVLRVARLLPVGRGGYLLAVASLALVSVAVAGRDRRFVGTLRRHLGAIVTIAALFTACFFGYAWFRSYHSDISGTEQPMDLMYLNATMNSPAYPPEDSWLAGERASYYYFGYLQIGMLTRAAAVPASEGYNLGLAYTFAAAAAGVASLALALGRWVGGVRARRWVSAGAGGVTLLLLGVGTLSALFEFAAAHGHYEADLFGLFGLDSLSGVRPTSSWYPTEFWFWFRGTRVIPGTITEFPFFSFLLGDLHPHVMSVPLVLLSLGASLSAWRGRVTLDWRTHQDQPFVAAGLALILGGLAFENAWDVLTFSAVFAGSVLLRNLRFGPPGTAVRASAGYLAPLAVVAVLLYLPWYADFRSQAGGLYPYVGAGTRPAHAFLQFGPVLLGGLLAVAVGPRIRVRDLRKVALWAVLVPVVPLAAWLFLAADHGQFGTALADRTMGGWVTLGAYAATTWALVAATMVYSRARHAAAAVAGLAAIAALLLYGSELLLVRDVFFGSVPRLNTVFKLSYQAWILLSLAGGVSLVLVVRGLWRTPSLRGMLVTPIAVTALAGLVYPVISLPNRTDGFDAPETTLDGLAFLARSDPDEYALTRWVQEHTAPGERIIEASGRAWRVEGSERLGVFDFNVDYTDAGRIAARTGRPSLVGWYFHEIQWRGDSQAIRDVLTARQDLADSAYTARTPDAVLAAMRAAGARYLVFGRVEQSRFPAGTRDHFDGVLDVVFSSGDLRVYAVPVYEVIATS